MKWKTQSLVAGPCVWFGYLGESETTLMPAAGTVPSVVEIGSTNHWGTSLACCRTNHPAINAYLSRLSALLRNVGPREEYRYTVPTLILDLLLGHIG